MSKINDVIGENEIDINKRTKYLEQKELLMIILINRVQ